MLFGFHWNYFSCMANLVLYINIINIMYLHFVLPCNLSYTNLTHYTVIYIRRYILYVGTCADIFANLIFIYFFSECPTAFLTLRQMLGKFHSLLLEEARVFSHILFLFLANSQVQLEHYLKLQNYHLKLEMGI